MALSVALWVTCTRWIVCLVSVQVSAPYVMTGRIHCLNMWHFRLMGTRFDLSTLDSIARAPDPSWTLRISLLECGNMIKDPSRMELKGVSASYWLLLLQVSLAFQGRGISLEHSRNTGWILRLILYSEMSSDICTPWFLRFLGCALVCDQSRYYHLEPTIL